MITVLSYRTSGVGSTGYAVSVSVRMPGEPLGRTPLVEGHVRGEASLTHGRTIEHIPAPRKTARFVGQPRKLVWPVALILPVHVISSSWLVKIHGGLMYLESMNYK